MGTQPDPRLRRRWEASSAAVLAVAPLAGEVQGCAEEEMETIDEEGGVSEGEGIEGVGGQEGQAAAEGHLEQGGAGVLKGTRGKPHSML